MEAEERVPRERTERRARPDVQPPPQPLIQPASLEWASAVGNQAVQRLARRYAEPAAEEEEQAPAEPEESAAPPAEEAAALAAVDDDAETLPE